MSGKSGNPGTPLEDCCVPILHFLMSIVISLIELLYKWGCSLCSGGMTKDDSFSLVIRLGPTDKFDVACASSSSTATDDFGVGDLASTTSVCLFMVFPVDSLLGERVFRSL